MRLGISDELAFGGADRGADRIGELGVISLGGSGETMSSASTTLTGTQRNVSTRTAWIDAARGVAVVLVVLLHYYIFCVAPNAMGYSGPSIVAWGKLIEVLGAFRMPMLFAVSGFLASKYIVAGRRASWRRARASYYLYTVWFLVYVMLSLIAPLGAPYSSWTFAGLVQNFYDPRTPLWFIFALAVYSLILPLFGKMPPRLVLTVLAAISIGAALLPGDGAQIFWLRILQYAVFFGIGVYARPLVLWIVTPQHWAMPFSLGLIVVASFAILDRPSLDNVPLLASAIDVSVDVAALLAGLGIVAALCRVKPFRLGACWIGRRTLPLYLLHIPSLWAVSLIPGELFNAHDLVRWLWPLIGTALVVALSWLAGWLIRRAGGGFLFTPPAWVVR